MTRAEKVISFLKESPEERFSPWQLAEKLVKRYPEDAEQLVRVSTQTFADERAVIKYIAATIYSNERRIIQLGEGKVKDVRSSVPRTYYYTEKTDEEEIEAEEQRIAPQKEPLERELYGGIMQFLSTEERIFCKRIEDRRSSNRQGRGGNKWLHPDIVGLQPLIDGWDEKVVGYGERFNNQHCRLWSFEVKRLVNRYNVREVFFQAVSNSSWAHYGYLVGNFNKDALDELEILSSLHGIGVIQYYPKGKGNGIVMPAREKEHLDWKTINRIWGQNNKDFLNFMKQVDLFQQTKEVSRGDNRWNSEPSSDL